MKKLALFISTMLSMGITVSAQLTVATNGYVGVQATSDTLLSALCVNSQGNANSKTHIYTASSGINIGYYKWSFLKSRNVSVFANSRWRSH